MNFQLGVSRLVKPRLGLVHHEIMFDASELQRDLNITRQNGLTSYNIGSNVLKSIFALQICVNMNE